MNYLYSEAWTVTGSGLIGDKPDKRREEARSERDASVKGRCLQRQPMQALMARRRYALLLSDKAITIPDDDQIGGISETLNALLPFSRDDDLATPQSFRR